MAYRFCKNADSQAKSQEVPLMDLQPVIAVPLPPTTDTPPRMGTAPPAYIPKLSFSQLLQEN